VQWGDDRGDNDRGENDLDSSAVDMLSQDVHPFVNLSITL